MLWGSALRMQGLVGALTVLCVTSVFSSIADASESNRNQFLIAQAGNPPPAAYNVPTEERATTRGLFLSTLIPAIASGLGGTLMNWFGQKVLTPSGQIQSLNTGGADGVPQVQESSGAPAPDVVLPPVAPVGIPAPRADLHAGIAYEVYVQGSDTRWIQVDPQTFIFATGQRFVVVYRPNLPGRLGVYNVNPQGQETAIDALDVSGGQLVPLGPYEFSGQKGDELLKIVLTPCVSSQAPAITRDIVRVDDTDASALPFRLSQCLPKSDAPPVGTRDIKKVAMEGGTAFGLDRISESELQTGNLTPRSLAISLQHR
jgi:hypothetical protein